jgi:hypothetical protein
MLRNGLPHITLGFVMILASAAPAAACRCVTPDSKSALTNATVAFIGKVTEISPSDESEKGISLVTFKVGQIMKGTPGTEVRAKTIAVNWSCSVEFEVGKSYEVYYSAPNPISFCNGSREYKEEPRVSEGEKEGNGA